MLDSDYPAVELYNNLYTFTLPSLTQNYKNVVKTKIAISPQTNPDDYLKPYDIIKRKIDKLGVTHHFAVYLGNSKVAHISTSETESDDRSREKNIFKIIANTKKNFGAKIDS